MAVQPSTATTALRPAESDAELDAYNQAFQELGLEWHWDRAVWAELRGIAGERERVCAYLRGWLPHLLTAYDAEFLGDAILEAKLRAAQGERVRVAELPH
jgi:hypothetical protein